MMRSVVPILLVPALLGLLSCGPAAPPPRGEAKVAAQEFAGAPPADRSAVDSTVPTERKQVKTGSVTVETADLNGAEKALADRTVRLGGLVESTQAQPRFRTLVLRLPADQFDGFLEGLGGLGRITARQVGVTDVTTQYVDLDTRIRNQRLLLDQYRSVLAKTVRLEDTLTAMEKISALTAEIESTEGQFRYLSRQIDLSTLTVELNLPMAEGGRGWPDWSAGFSDLVHILADLGVGTVLFLLGALVIAPVAVGLLALFYWLWLGRPGLWRRIRGLRKP